jgi:hypothetical protein
MRPNAVICGSLCPICAQVQDHRYCRSARQSFAATGCGHSSCQPLWHAITSPGPPSDPYISLVTANGITYVSGNGQLVDAFRASGCGSSECIPLWAYSAPQIQLGESGSRPEHALRRNREGLEAFFPARCPVGTVGSTPTWIDPAAPGATLLVANGVVYANSALSILADDATTGTRLWHTAIPGTNPPRNGPTLANGAVYVADTTGAEILAYHL